MMSKHEMPNWSNCQIRRWKENGLPDKLKLGLSGEKTTRENGFSIRPQGWTSAMERNREKSFFSRRKFLGHTHLKLLPILIEKIHWCYVTSTYFFTKRIWNVKIERNLTLGARIFDRGSTYSFLQKKLRGARLGLKSLSSLWDKRSMKWTW